jgi:Flp pilus assembly protein TadD
MGIPLLTQLSNKVLSNKTRLLVLIATAVVTTSCVSSQATKSDREDIFAAYSVDEILEAGNESFDNEEFERAVFIYMQALEIEKNAETWYRIGLGKSRLGDKAYAWQALKKSIELDPNHALSLQELGLINLAVGEPAQAELHLARATEIDPTLWRAWNARGVIADIDHRYEEAVLYYQSGLIGAPNSEILMNNIGYSYYLAGDLQEATRWFGRAILATPDYEPAIKNLGLLYARQGWYDEAVSTFSKVVDKAQAYNDVGYLAMRNGDYGKASELLTQAIRLAPTYYEKAYENLEIVRKEQKKAGNEVSDTGDLSNIGAVIFPDSTTDKTHSVIPRALNVRSGPSSDSKIINYLRAGNEVEVIMTLPGWAFINYRPLKRDENLTGWVNSNYLSGIGDDKNQSSATTAKSAEPKLVTKEIINPAEALAIEAIQPPALEPASSPKIAVAASESKAAPADRIDSESIIKSIDAVCGLNEINGQAQKTPHVAGSCIGVASADADE